MQVQHSPRYKKRVPCEFDDSDGQHYRGIVLNVSRSGLFVRSRIAPKVGSRVTLDISHSETAPAIPLRARVVWKRRVHGSASSIEAGGIGLELEADSAEYERFVCGLGGGSAAPPEPPREEASNSYSVRLALGGTPRTRCVKLSASSPEEAAKVAQKRNGEGWEVIDVNSLS